MDTWQKRRFHSFEFAKPKSYSKTKAIDILVKKVFKNMQWGKTKRGTNASDQTSNDTPLFKQEK